MKAKSIAFQVERCQNTTANQNRCATPQEIDNYIKDITVDYWSIGNKMDMTEFGGLPIKREMKILSQNLLG